MQDICELLV